MADKQDLVAVNEEIGVCGLLLKHEIGLARCEDAVKMTITTGHTQPGIWLHFQQCFGTKKGLSVPAHLYTQAHAMIVELDEDQTEALLQVLLKAIRCHAYGAGINEMGGM
jgi:hypothetical protein